MGGTTPGTGARRRLRPAFAGALRRRRRLLARLLLAGACGTAVEAVADGPGGSYGPVRVVAVAAGDLAAGQVLGATDVRTVDLPVDVVPAGALSRREAADAAAGGMRVPAAVRAGEVLTDARIGGPGMLVGTPPGTVAVAVPLTDPATAALVHEGEAVEVLAAGGLDPTGLPVGGAQVVVDRAVVLARAGADGGGLLGADDAAGSGGVVLAVSRAQARSLAGALAAGSTSGSTLVVALLQ